MYYDNSSILHWVIRTAYMYVIIRCLRLRMLTPFRECTHYVSIQQKFKTIAYRLNVVRHAGLRLFTNCYVQAGSYTMLLNTRDIHIIRGTTCTKNII